MPEQIMAREILLHLTSGTFPGDGWVTDEELLRVCRTEDLGTLWAALNLLDAAGITQRNTGGRARLHPRLRGRL